MPAGWETNIEILESHLRSSNQDININYALITSSKENLSTDKIPIKYLHESQQLQLTKICDFICQFKQDLVRNYDVFIKTRPDLVLLDDINIDDLPRDGICARARVYSRNMSMVRYGMSVERPITWAEDDNSGIILDDMLYIFNVDLIPKFSLIRDVTSDMYKTPHGYCLKEHEWFHTYWWDYFKIKKYVIGFNALVLDSDRRIRFRSGHTDGTGSY